MYSTDTNVIIQQLFIATKSTHVDIPVTTCDLVYFLNRLQFQCQNKSLDGVSGIVWGMGDAHIHLDSRVYVPAVMRDLGGSPHGTLETGKSLFQILQGNYK